MWTIRRLLRARTSAETTLVYCVNVSTTLPFLYTVKNRALTSTITSYRRPGRETKTPCKGGVKPWLGSNNPDGTHTHTHTHTHTRETHTHTQEKNDVRQRWTQRSVNERDARWTRVTRSIPSGIAECVSV